MTDQELKQTDDTLALLERKVRWLETNFELLLSILSKPIFSGSQLIPSADFDKDITTMRGVRQDFLNAQKKLEDAKTAIDPEKIPVAAETAPLTASIKEAIEAKGLDLPTKK